MRGCSSRTWTAGNRAGLAWTSSVPWWCPSCAAACTSDDRPVPSQRHSRCGSTTPLASGADPRRRCPRPFGKYSTAWRECSPSSPKGASQALAASRPRAERPRLGNPGTSPCTQLWRRPLWLWTSRTTKASSRAPSRKGEPGNCCTPRRRKGIPECGTAARRGPPPAAPRRPGPWAPRPCRSSHSRPAIGRRRGAITSTSRTRELAGRRRRDAQPPAGCATPSLLVRHAPCRGAHEPRPLPVAVRARHREARATPAVLGAREASARGPPARSPAATRLRRPCRPLRADPPRNVDRSQSPCATAMTASRLLLMHRTSLRLLRVSWRRARTRRRPWRLPSHRRLSTVRRRLGSAWRGHPMRQPLCSQDRLQCPRP
mmetsp:Transcript_29674/g.81223  ORF Transcript_29674/g.81223 Transcript_29674/m.81223 type:complete len:373 (+) Transcript_29674:936-2054(+)